MQVMQWIPRSESHNGITSTKPVFGPGIKHGTREQGNEIEIVGYHSNFIHRTKRHNKNTKRTYIDNNEYYICES